MMATPIRRSQRLLVLQSKATSSGCSLGSFTVPDSANPSVLRRSQRLLQSRTSTNSIVTYDGVGIKRKQKETVSEVEIKRKQKETVSGVEIKMKQKETVSGVEIKRKQKETVSGVEIKRMQKETVSGVEIKMKQKETVSGVEIKRKQKETVSGVEIKRMQKETVSGVEIKMKQKETVSGVEIKRKQKETVSGVEIKRKQKETVSGVEIKRKQKEIDDVVQGTDSGWTKEQEKALQRAFFAVDPTPKFWKLVAQQVPGKSVQECFDKINSENPTPRARQPRSRIEKKTLSPQLEISFSETTSKRERICSRKNHINHKMVRQLQRKQSQLEPDGGDLFHIFEPTASPLPEAVRAALLLSTPTEKGSASRSRSLSHQKKSKSRLSGKFNIPIPSPLVLKPVENMALHDKYLDQLHARDAKRNCVSTRRSALLQRGATEPPLKNKDVVQAAKESLLSVARDAINRFRDSEMHLETNDDSDEIYDDEEDCED